jgi:hypothetical protein
MVLTPLKNVQNHVSLEGYISTIISTGMEHGERCPFVNELMVLQPFMLLATTFFLLDESMQ